MLFAPTRGQLERKLENAVHADACHYGLLNDKFALSARKHASADRRIFAFRVFPHDVEIDVAGIASCERTRNAGHQPHRPQVDILVDLAPTLAQRTPYRYR